MRRNELKITTFNPLIVTAHSDDIISLFRDLGFEVRHEKKELDSVSSKLVRMRDANGNHVDIVQQDQMPRDLTSIRMNVNSFQEAYDLQQNGWNDLSRQNGERHWHGFAIRFYDCCC